MSDAFERLEQVGEGTYGQVYRAKDLKTGEIVALKKVKLEMEREGFPITAIREIKILKSLSHPNIVDLKEIVTSRNRGIKGHKRPVSGSGSGDAHQGPPHAQDEESDLSIYMVFEYMDHDLTGLLQMGTKLTQRQVKSYMRQLLDGVAYMHRNKIIHRDIKGSNLLLDNNGFLKIADWGLARPWNDLKKHYTNKVITLWYRPPELLLGQTAYDQSIDIWSVGCILVELLDSKPCLPGRDEIDQLRRIFHLCGSPTAENWPGHETLKEWDKFKPEKPFTRTFRQRFKHLPEQAVDLVNQMLQLDPKRRMSAQKALDHDYFWTDPMPCAPSDLPKFNVKSAHEYDAKLRHEAMKAQQQQQRRNSAKRHQSQHPSHNGGGS